MATRSQLQKIESVHLDAIDSGDVTECLGHALILVINNERSQLLNSSPVSELALAGPHPASGVHLGYVGPGVGLSQEDDGVLGLGVALDLVGHDHRHLGDLADLVALGHDEGWDTGGRDGRAHGVTLLGNVHFPVPPSPGLSRSEHPPTAAHVTEGSLSRTVSTTAPDTGDPGHSTTSAPGLGRCLVTSVNIDTVRLSLVLGDFVMNKGDDVGPHRGSEHSRETDGSARTLVLLGIDADQWAGRCERHFMILSLSY